MNYIDMMINNIKEFNNYVQKYNFDGGIKLKYYHSLRVMNYCYLIAKSLNLRDEDMYLATLIGLLHDIGRFKQWQLYKSFSDYDTINHAEVGNQILFDGKYIEKFSLDKKYYDLVRTAIKEHNLFKLDELNDEELLFSKIIRDADKIDIIDIMSRNELNILNSDDSKVSDNVRNEFYLNHSINKKDKKTKNDDVILKIALIYDLNFDYSKKTIIECGYLDKMSKHLNNNIFGEYFDYANEYLNRSENYVRKRILS